MRSEKPNLQRALNNFTEGLVRYVAATQRLHHAANRSARHAERINEGARRIQLNMPGVPD